MKNKIEITEEDTFKFVFSQETLSKAKFDYLDSNRERFENEIALCLQLKNESISGEVSSLTETILHRINAPDVIRLFPQIAKPTAENSVKLAAASVLKEKKPNSLSFVDVESKYLVRIVRTDTQNMLYLFTSDNSATSLKIRFHPSEEVYQIDDISQPIAIVEEKKIEEITIEELSK